MADKGKLPVPHYLVSKLLRDMTKDQLKRFCQRADVGMETVRSWHADNREAGIDKFCKLANAAGYEVVLLRVQPTIEPEQRPMIAQTTPRTAATSKLRVFDRNGRTEVMDGGKLAGYVEADTLYGIGKDGYASPVADINHRAEIIGKLENWRNKQ